ncbi:uncharacterized protein AMSG_08005 [Thecamonas trahens ATCC 50062]|uniref:Uncharacterized protein n=1 Tax=Thecamonas trahens ATCC 50062 TaxID=461836 RepID=A0A0L0DI37_THETB|nr:hypothetical protein AMSG_08005 [Thecamonas trahens ATCC 50062]KNC51905.1 hypothetical protein AMSG_08005 [Thecamonas trahens ATCC 50062]|eukprot:XP_013755761.1 hypothetical protein AMSG_08005 [Thecamonas trahens ATCC 50062]
MSTDVANESETTSYATFRVVLNVPWDAPLGGSKLDMNTFVRSNTLRLPRVPDFELRPKEAAAENSASVGATTSTEVVMRLIDPRAHTPTPAPTPIKRKGDKFASLTGDAQPKAEPRTSAETEAGSSAVSAKASAEADGEAELDAGWTKEMDRIVWSFVTMTGLSDAQPDGLDWTSLAQRIGGVTPEACMARAALLFERRLRGSGTGATALVPPQSMVAKTAAEPTAAPEVRRLTPLQSGAAAADDDNALMQSLLRLSANSAGAFVASASASAEPSPVSSPPISAGPVSLSGDDDSFSESSVTRSEILAAFLDYDDPGTPSSIL